MLFSRFSRSISTQLKGYIEKIKSENKVLLFMKGTPQQPQCKFSRSVVQLLHQNGSKEFATVNVLEDEELRQAIKEYSNWPTIPQLYIKGEFIGGCDVISELAKTGELKKKLMEQE